MASPHCVLSLEVSTTSAKCILYSEDEGILSSKVMQYPASVSDGRTQDPNGIVAAALEVLALAVKDAKGMGFSPSAIGLCGTWHSLLLLDRGMEPLGRIRTWADLSGAPAAAKARSEGKSHEYYLNTGCMVHGSYPCWKLSSLKEVGDESLKAAKRAVSQVEWLYYALTGEFAVSSCVASGSGLLNIHTLAYDRQALSYAGIDEGMLSPVEDLFSTGRLSKPASSITGLPEGLPVSVGGADGALNQLAVGGLSSGVMSMSVGTSGALRRAATSPKLAEKPSTWCYNLTEGAWITGAAISNATNCVDWLVSLTGGIVGDQSAYSPLEQAAAGAQREEAPIFLPFLFGERCPGWEEGRKGGFVGLSAEHKSGDLYYSVLEGITFNMLQCYGILEKLSGSPPKIVASGGITRSRFWMQMASDVFGKAMQTTGSGNDSTVGAALVALAALKGSRRIDLPDKAAADIYYPDEGNTNLIRSRFERYLRLYDETSPQKRHEP